MAISTLPRAFQDVDKKALVLCLVIVTAMAMLVARLVWLQILQNKYYTARSVENSTRVIFLRAPRGIIYDRHGNLLATNKQTLSMTAIPRQLDDIEYLATRLARVVDVPVGELQDRLIQAKNSDSVLPVVIERDVDLATVGRFYEQ